MQGSINHAEMVGRRVGRYTVVKHLASGGMAELYVARQQAVGGFEKQLVLKLLQGRYADNPRVVEMFLDEARLAAKLNHPSIVHVYDVAEDDGVKFIAMEHIHGETLTDIIRRGVAVGNYLPLEHGVHIVSQTAAGLAYAHGRFDEEGAPFRIVHRDISPSNILVSYEGQTKIVDFGIARIQDQIREEWAMRPGKASYMSPEQVAGESADYRSDIFSLGIILYEITLRQRLWRGPANEVMRRIVEEKIAPPTSVRRNYPPALELVVMKALEKRPGDRYQSTEEMRNDLEEFLDEAGLRTGPRRLASYLKQLFAPEAPVSEQGIAQARQLAEEDPEHKSVMADESEELNFDRRASFTMRVEAAPATTRRSPPQGLGVVTASPPAGLLAEGGDSAVGRLSAARPLSTPTSGVGEPSEVAPLTLPDLPPGPAPGRNADPATATLGSLEPLTVGPPFGESIRGSARLFSGGQRSGSGQIWLLLAVLMLLGIGAIVFIGLR
ncbi:MAG TPA: serine/threonine-protein kinase [Polyangia bacterium]|jgi:serine/threonine protein kinase|nr:serine/threonine-protein kinase [Polyangia bacterium]